MFTLNRWRSAALLAALCSSAAGSVSLAKPPDLPIEQDITVPEGREPAGSGDLFDALREAVQKARIEIDLVLPGGDGPVMLDMVVPTLLPQLLAEGLRRQMMEPAPSIDELDPSSDQGEQARQMFEEGERCRRQGNATRARTCYEEAHLLSPTSRFGRLAIQRLDALDRVNDSAEEQEEPPTRRAPTTDEPPLSQGPAKQSFDKIRRGSQPLGLVEPSY
jgi:hypothetical protein